VTVIGISNAMLMSVTERIREIGTMKCLGALSGFVVKLFLIESFLIGIVGAVVGTMLGFVVPFVAYMLNSGVELLFASTPFLHLTGCGAGSIAVGTVLAIVAAIYPAVVAAKMVPADALRTNV
jgi:ABC-type antimicrobial peptide transport system permease subunit